MTNIFLIAKEKQPNIFIKTIYNILGIEIKKKYIFNTITSNKDNPKLPDGYILCKKIGYFKTDSANITQIREKLYGSIK
jgi:hypothetical protein